MTSRTMADNFVPTAGLRFVLRDVRIGEDLVRNTRILQQWWAPEVPRYMRGPDGEWRDVELVDAPP